MTKVQLPFQSSIQHSDIYRYISVYIYISIKNQSTGKENQSLGPSHASSASTLTRASQIDWAMNFPLSTFSIFSNCSIFFLHSILVTTFAQTGPQIAAYFRQTLSHASAVYLPSEGNYSFETTQRWNLFSAPTYIVSVKPTSDLDVSKIVRLSHSPSPEAHLHKSTHTCR